MESWRNKPRKAAPRPGCEKSRQREAQRITNPRHRSFADYGGRGLDMDPRWQSFQAFLDDMGVKPEGTSLGRIDNDRGYWPGNCRWETSLQQSNNKRNNQTITVDGKTMTLAEWARVIGCSRQAVRYRLHAGWTPEQIISAVDRTKRRVA